MQILMIPVPGPGPTTVRVEASLLVVNQTDYPLNDLPQSGPVRLDGEIVLIEYGQDGALASCQIGETHELRYIPFTEAPVETQVTDPEPAAEA